MKRALAFCLVCISVMLCFAGCGKEGGSSGGKGDKQAFLEEFLKATYDEPDGNIHYSYQAPSAFIEMAKEKGKWDDLVNNYKGNFFLDSTGSRYIPESVEKVGKLSNEELKYAENYFQEEYEEKVTVRSGDVYYLVIEISYKDKDPTKLSGYIVVLDVDGEGYKIFFGTPNELKNKYSEID
ncbi:MAG: hypothetical protein IKO47_12605 [Ruminococcus sp.]|nr:hypothetical protein [Ruminococcus sp.]